MQVSVEMLNRLHQEPDLVFGEINFHEPSLSHGSNLRLGFVWYRWSRGDDCIQAAASPGTAR
jgi:hypothetical protein